MNVFDEILSNHKKVLIIDSYNLMHRYLWTLKNIHVENKKVGHIVGYTQTLQKILSDRSTAVICVFEGKNSTQKRKTLDPNYKANRTYQKDFDDGTYVDLVSDELILESMMNRYHVLAERKRREQLRRFDNVDIVEGSVYRKKDFSLGVPGIYKVSVPGLEADDAIIQISNELDIKIKEKYKDRRVFISSTDKDLLCCLTENVRIILKYGKTSPFSTKDGAELRDLEYFKNEFSSIAPSKLFIFKALTGDSSDNIKGIPRFRKSIAFDIVNKCSFKELISIYSNSTECDDAMLEYFNKCGVVISKKQVSDFIDYFSNVLQNLKVLSPIKVKDIDSFILQPLKVCSDDVVNNLNMKQWSAFIKGVVERWEV